MKEEQIDNFALLLEEAKVTTSPKRLKELALLDFKTGRNYCPERIYCSRTARKIRLF